jgi:drug/metabolite transporter (DMT)-like permease
LHDETIREIWMREETMTEQAVRTTEGGARARLPEMVLAAVALVWGGTFLLTQAMLRETGPFSVLAIRFTIAALALAALFPRRMRGLTAAEARAGAVIGAVTFASYALQTVGLETIASSRSAFITSMYVPLVPLLQLALMRHSPRAAAWVGIAISFAGLLMLSHGGGAGTAFGAGEWLTLGGAVGAALQIVLLSRWAAGAEPMRLAAVQIAAVAVLSLAAMPLAGEGWPPPTAGIWIPGLALGLVGTAFALAAMSWAQRTVSATSATVIYATEPVWGGVAGALAGEAMTGATVGGSALIVVGVVVSEIRWRRGGAAREAVVAERAEETERDGSPHVSIGRREMQGEREVEAAA